MPQRRTPSAEISSPRRSVYQDAAGDLHLVPDSTGMRLGDAAREIKRQAGWCKGRGDRREDRGDNLLWAGSAAQAIEHPDERQVMLELLREAESVLHRAIEESGLGESEQDAMGCQLRILDFLSKHTEECTDG